MCNYPLNLFDQACAPIKEREILNAHDDTFWYIGLSYQIKLASHREKKIKWYEMRWWHAYSHTCFIIRLIDCIPKVIEDMFIHFYHMFVINDNTNEITCNSKIKISYVRIMFRCTIVSQNGDNLTTLHAQKI